MEKNEKELLYMFMTWKTSEYIKKYHIKGAPLPELTLAKFKIEDQFLITELSYNNEPTQTSYYKLNYSTGFSGIEEGKWYDASEELLNDEKHEFIEEYL